VVGTAAAGTLQEARIDIGRGNNPDRLTTVVRLIKERVIDRVLVKLPAGRFSGGEQWTGRTVVAGRNGLEREARFKLTLG
jgi:hypothetical protein